MKEAKPGIIRPGNKIPYTKSTEAEVERRVSYIENTLRTKPILKHVLRRKVRKKFNVSRRQAEDYIAQARDRIVISLQQSRTEHRSESLTLYQSILLSPTSTDLAKLRAQEQLDLLLGLRAPYQSQVQIDAHLSAAQSQEVSTDDILEFLDFETTSKLLDAIRKAKAKRGLPHTGRDSPLPLARPAGLLPSSTTPTTIDAEWSS